MRFNSFVILVIFFDFYLDFRIKYLAFASEASKKNEIFGAKIQIVHFLLFLKKMNFDVKVEESK